MHNYEIMTITKLSIGDEKAKAVSKEIQDLIAANKGAIVKSDFWGKRKLAYEIKADKEAFFDVIDFKLDSANLSKITTKIRLMDDVIRYLISSVPEVGAEKEKGK